MVSPHIVFSSLLLLRNIPADTLNCRWYFDVASTTTDETITLAFFNRGPDGVLGNVPSLSTVIVQLSGTFKNGTAYSIQAPALPDASAVLSVSENSVYGDWQSTGYQFAGTEGGTKWVVSIHDEAHDVFGSLTFESVSRPSCLFIYAQSDDRDMRLTKMFRPHRRTWLAAQI